MAQQQEFTYSFSVWPDEKSDFDPAVFELFRLMPARIEVRFSAEDFQAFRAGLARHGITLREISRAATAPQEPIL